MYGTTKNGDVHIKMIESVASTVSALDRHQPLSGFPSTEAWLDTIEMHSIASSADKISFDLCDCYFCSQESLRFDRGGSDE